jgi:endonuclease G
MSPQRPDFNRGGWAKLEDMMRAYVIEKHTALFIVTGPVLTDTMKYVKRSKNHVAIPDFFFKVAYDTLNQKGIGFLMPNKKLEYPTEYYAKSIDEIEKITKIDFFAALPDNIEHKIESQQDVSWWLPEAQKGDVAPMNSKQLPKNYFNTIEARHFIDSGEKVKICGTVVSTYKSRKGNVFLNLDKQYPNQIFTITIFASNLMNFSYKPEEYLKNKKICVRGKVSEFRGVPSMIIDNEKQIELFEDIRKK